MAVGTVDQNLAVGVTLKSIIVMRNSRAASTLSVAYQPTCVSVSADDSLVAVGSKVLPSSPSPFLACVCVCTE